MNKLVTLPPINDGDPPRQVDLDHTYHEVAGGQVLLTVKSTRKDVLDAVMGRRDLDALKAVLPPENGPVEFVARWDGPFFLPVGPIVLHAQTREDEGVLQNVVPLDRPVTMTVQWTSDTTLLLADKSRPSGLAGGVPPAANPAFDLAGEIAKLGTLSDKDLETLAAERQVKWDPKQSKVTRVLAVAQAAPGNASK